jgi:hypothetical protein
MQSQQTLCPFMKRVAESNRRHANAGQNAFRIEPASNFLRVRFPSDVAASNYGNYDVLASREKGGSALRIQTWVVTANGCGFHLDDVVTSEEGFADAIRALRPNLTPAAIEAAFLASRRPSKAFAC